DLTSLKEERDKAKTYSESVIEGLAETNARIRDNGSNLRDFEDAVERCKETIETAGIYRELYEAASGKTSRINFNQYVLGKYLDDITVTASERLKSMSGGRYEIIRKLENDDRRKMQALDFRIHDHDSEIDREINSLSGGESFMTSLSLALALSNTIQGLARGKTVEALFIDEGFGSLDETAINQAIRVLKGMSEGMSIGVISHVQRLLDLIEDHVTVKYTKGVGSRLVSE
ncbi:MAG: hypothetical protein MJZ68_08480, partial [archaeon]|nr:hypothetical protein [archaeon]